MSWLTSLQRLHTGKDAGIGTQFFASDQTAMRNAAKSRYGVFAQDATARVQHPASHVMVHDDGTLDVTSLDCDGDTWFDLGGISGVDFAAGR